MSVYLVGAGPGDPDLVTVRAASLIARADVVMYDRLVDERILSMAPADARRLDVGKRAGSGGAARSQDDINALLVRLGREGGSIVRLKGGDPYVFGRGGEEAQALEDAGIDYEVVPGLSSAIAVPAYAGVPVTHRGVASGFIVVTGHDLERNRDAVAEWSRVVRAGCTLVVLMGVATRHLLASGLIAGGCSPSTPVLVVERGTTPAQRSTRTTLALLGGLAVSSPATVVVGDAAALAFASIERRPLFGWRVVVTRPAEQAHALVAPLLAAGATAVPLPLLEIRAPRDGGTALREAASRLAEHDWVVLTSANGVERLFGEMRDARCFGAARVAAIGPATAAALRAHGIVADLVPEQYDGKTLLAALHAAPSAARRTASGVPRVLVVRASIARDVVPIGLASIGWDVTTVDAYETVSVDARRLDLSGLDGAHAVTFASPSAVAAFLAAAGREQMPPVVASIGPLTSAAVVAAGIAVDVEASEHTSAGLVGALVDHAKRQAPGTRGD